MPEYCSWAAREKFPGVNFIPVFPAQVAAEVIESIKRQSRPEDLVIFSVHWGSNWGYRVPEEQIHFARALIDSGAVDVIHGHSSHNVRPLEIYRGKLILYGAGDFLNDYEGIAGNEDYRDDLSLMYFPTFDCRTGRLTRLRIIPLQIFRFSLRRASVPMPPGQRVLNGSRHFGTRAKLGRATDIEVGQPTVTGAGGRVNSPLYLARNPSDLE
jgi:poly-gamma-glutamate synthesis protein (capsule biosynthesis protein)